MLNKPEILVKYSKPNAKFSVIFLIQSQCLLSLDLKAQTQDQEADICDVTEMSKQVSGGESGIRDLVILQSELEQQEVMMLLLH